MLLYCRLGGVTQCTARCSRVERLQKRIVRNLFARFYRSAGCLFGAAGVLKLKDVYRERVCMYMHKMVHGGEHAALKNSLNLALPDHGYETRTASTSLVLPFPRVEAVRMNYTYQFINVWNGISTSIREETRVKCFKKLLKHHFLQNY